MCIQIVKRGVSVIFLERAYRIKMKLLGHHEGNVPLTKRKHVHAATAINTVSTNVTTSTNLPLLMLLFLLLRLLLQYLYY